MGKQVQIKDNNGAPLQRRQKYIVTFGRETHTGTWHGEFDERNGYPIISTPNGGIAIGPECHIVPAPIAQSGAGGQHIQVMQ